MLPFGQLFFEDVLPLFPSPFLESIHGFAILDKFYEEKTKSDQQREAEEKEKATLSDRAKPLNVAVTKKKLKIVGWSRNLLQNASGAVGIDRYIHFSS